MHRNTYEYYCYREKESERERERYVPRSRGENEHGTVLTISSHLGATSSFYYLQHLFYAFHLRSRVVVRETLRAAGPPPLSFHGFTQPALFNSSPIPKPARTATYVRMPSLYRVLPRFNRLLANNPAARHCTPRDLPGLSEAGHGRRRKEESGGPRAREREAPRDHRGRPPLVDLRIYFHRNPIAINSRVGTPHLMQSINGLYTFIHSM